MSDVPPVRTSLWRELIPSRRGWLGVVASPSSYVLALCFVVTAIAKAAIMAEIGEVDAWPLAWSWSIGLDLVFYFTLLALFAVGETMRRWIAVLTSILTTLAVALGAINAMYLGEAGEQITWQTLVTGVDRFGDAWSIASKTLGDGIILVILGTLVCAAPPLVVYGWFFRRRGLPLYSAEQGRERALCALPLVVAGALLWLLMPEPGPVHARHLGSNAIIDVYRGFGRVDPGPAIAEEGGSGSFDGYSPAFLVRPDAIEDIRRGQRPNVLVVVLESTRLDYTELDPGGPRRGAETPRLRALADRGASFTRARAVLPHTSKSLYSILCARFPTMQRWIVETSHLTRVQCLPSILAAAGYRSAFFQSSMGIFEERPRLVANLGFQEFYAYEELRGEPLGYLASDDESLAPAVLDWVRRSDEPFVVTVLTSATHHPYRITKTIRQRAARQGKPVGEVEDRYARLVEAEDHMLGEILDGLKEQGVLDDTIVVAVGDHGEGFGEKGVRQHDNNFFDEGLRAPLVIAGPNVPQVEIAENVSLADVTPTVLGRLGVEIAPAARESVAGLDVLSSPVPADRPLLFTCWYQKRCQGVIRGNDKIVMAPERGEVYYFDLEDDPGEERPRRLPRRLYELTDWAARTIERYRTGDVDLRWDEVRFGAWHCPAGQRDCRHPRSDGKLREWMPDSLERAPGSH